VSQIDAMSKSVDGDQQGRLLGEMLQMLKTTTAQNSQQPVEDTSNLARELEVERRKVRVGSERIAQLERWLDTIFNDQQLGIGPSAVRGTSEQTPRLSLPPVDGKRASHLPAAADNSKTRSRPSDLSRNKPKHARSSNVK